MDTKLSSERLHKHSIPIENNTPGGVDVVDAVVVVGVIVGVDVAAAIVVVAVAHSEGNATALPKGLPYPQMDEYMIYPALVCANLGFICNFTYVF